MVNVETPNPPARSRKVDAAAAWDLMSRAAQGGPVARGDLRTAIRRAWPAFGSALIEGDPTDSSEPEVARSRCTVIFGALASLWHMEPHDVEELWTGGLLDSVLRDEFRSSGRLDPTAP